MLQRKCVGMHDQS